MPRLLVVHHTPSPTMQAVLEAVREDVALVEEVEACVRPALSAGAADVLAADGVLLGTPANIGYMFGALKHFFDTVYYSCLDATAAGPTLTGPPAPRRHQSRRGEAGTDGAPALPARGPSPTERSVLSRDVWGAAT